MTAFACALAFGPLCAVAILAAAIETARLALRVSEKRKPD